MSKQRVLYHTLSKPEILWLDFFRGFFSQKFLMINDDNSYIVNRFYIDQSISPDNRPFDVFLSFDFSKSNQNILPAVVIEDMSGASQMGLTIDQRRDFMVSPSTMKRRVDQVRYTYVIHCLSKDRGESRTLAAICARAVAAFRDLILSSRLGVVKIDPWSIGTTQPIRSDSREVYLDTPVQITFYMMDSWDTFIIEGGTAESLCVFFISDAASRFIRSAVNIKNPDLSSFILSSLSVSNPSGQGFVLSHMETQDPLSLESFIASSTETEDALSESAFIRSSTRVA